MKSLLIFALAFLLTVASLWAVDPRRQMIFIVERSKNANIVQYDVQLGADGKLDQKQPVVAYWVRLAEEGQTRKLSWLQRKFVYGFRAKLDKESDSVELDMVADLGRDIHVSRQGREYRASTQIENSDSWLDEIFVASSGDGISSRVDYLELHGVDKDSGEKRFERILP